MKWLLKWTENIRLTYFDHYHMRLKESLTSGKTVDYSDYINTCMEFKEKAMNLLSYPEERCNLQALILSRSFYASS